MKFRLSQVLTLSAAVFTPLVSFAAPQDFAGVVYFVLSFIRLLVPLIIGVTFLYVIWGIAKMWIIDAGNEESTKSGRMIFITGVIGLIVMVGMWGLVSLVKTAIFF